MIKFGTGGWRAIIGDEYTKRNVRLVAQAIAEYVLDNKSPDIEAAVVIGYDRRFLSQSSAEWIASVMAANGVKVYLMDEHGPTPVTMFTVGQLGIEFGIAITASHNSAEYNGIKFFVDGGRDAPVEVTNDIEERIANTKRKRVQKTKFKKALKSEQIIYINPLFDYIDKIKSQLNLEAIRERNLRVLVDPMYGSGKTALPATLFNIKVRSDIIHDDHDVLFGGQTPSPSSSNLIRLRELVVRDGYDLGLATDGDADRLGVVTDTGDYLHPNDILVLLYYYLLEHKQIHKPVVRNLATTHLLDRIARAYGQEAVEVPVGFKNITDGMQESGAYLGGESSGGLATSDHIMGKDGIYAATLICEVVSVLNKSLSEIMAEIHDKFGKLYMNEVNYPITTEDRERIQKLLFEDRELPEFKAEIDHISYNDGMKIYFADDTWILVRFSGTEPVLRVYAEKESQEEAEAICQHMHDFLQLTEA